MPNLHPCFKCVCKCEEQHQFALTCGDCDGSLIIHLMDEEIIVWSGGILLLWVCMYTCFPIHVIMLRRYTDWPQNISIYLFTPLSNSSLSFILLTSFVTLFFSSHSIHNVSLISFIALTMIIRQHLTEKKKNPHLSPLAVDSYFSAAYLKTINERHLLKYWISHIFQVDWLSGCSFA